VSRSPLTSHALAKVVHRSWRDGMLQQGRKVAPERMAWDKLSAADQALDTCIAEMVVLELATHDLPFLPDTYTMARFDRDELAVIAKAAQARGQSLASVDMKSGMLMLSLGYGLAQLLADTAPVIAPESHGLCLCHDCGKPADFMSCASCVMQREG